MLLSRAARIGRAHAAQGTRTAANAQPDPQLANNARRGRAPSRRSPTGRHTRRNDRKGVGGWRGGWADLEVVKLTERLGRYFGTDEGLLVISAPESNAFKLQDGDVILFRFNV